MKVRELINKINHPEYLDLPIIVCISYDYNIAYNYDLDCLSIEEVRIIYNTRIEIVAEDYY